MNKLRRIKKAFVTHVSLCKRGKNGIGTLMKSIGSDDARFELRSMAKMQKDGLLTTVVYAPDRPDVDGWAASREVISDAAHNFLANGGNVDIEHDLNPLGPDRIRIAEHFIIQKSDPRFTDWKDDAGKPVGDLTGGWAIIFKVLDPSLQAAYESGEWNGVSMFGLALLEPVAKSVSPTDDTMTPEQIAELAKSLAPALAESVVAGISKALKPAAPEAPKSEPIPFEGDHTNLADIEAHEEKLLFKSLDFSKTGDIAKWKGYLAAKLAKATKPTDEKPADESAELRKAKADLATAQAQVEKLAKSSTAPVPAAPKGEEKGLELVGLSKSENEQWNVGLQAARALDKMGLRRKSAAVSTPTPNKQD